MAEFNWHHEPLSAADVLSRAKTLRLHRDRHEIDLTSQLVPSDVYLNWARNCLMQNTPFGRDAALCYAKRAVCRDIDAFLRCNHFARYLGDSYPQKIKMLSEVGLCIPDIVHEFIIDPRNDVEHRYTTSTDAEASRAVDLAKLFIKATHEERQRHALIAIGWSISVHEERSCAPGNEYERIEFQLAPSAPMLLVDVCSAEPHVMIIYSRESEVASCPLLSFSREQTITLVKMLRQHYECEGTGGWSVTVRGCTWLAKLKADLRLTSIFG